MGSSDTSSVGKSSGVRGRRGVVTAAIAIAATVIALGGVWLFTASGVAGSTEDVAGTALPETEPVVRGDLQGSTTASGTLRYADPRSVQSGTSGTVTSLPAPRSIIGLGGQLYAVNNVPVFLLRGSLPAWRDFMSGMDDGPDVKQLEESLRELGFFSAEPDDEFGWATYKAITAWQEAHGVEESGELPLGSVVFSDSDLRVGTVGAAIGDRVSAGSELFGVSDTTQIVEANIKLADQQLAVIGAPVVVRLPEGTSTTGTIASVGTPTEVTDAGGQKQTAIPVVVALDDPAAGADFQEAAVSVDIPSESRENVLSVPVGALIAISPQQFGVEVVEADGTTHQVPVTTGLFAGGRVEISGDDVEAGMNVVVPKL